MDDASARIVEKVQDLSDLEIATLLCLITNEHCIIEGDTESLGDLTRELELIASDVFGLKPVVVECSENTSLDDFGNALLIAEEEDSYFDVKRDGRDDLHYPSFSSLSSRHTPRRSPRSQGTFDTSQDTKKIANVIIAKNLNLTSQQVQIQALELIRGKRIFTRTAVHVAPKRFLFSALLSTDSEQPLTQHLNDHISISHLHNPEDGLPNLEDQAPSTPVSSSSASTKSVIRTPGLSKSPIKGKRKAQDPVFNSDDIEHLKQLTSAVVISPEIRSYLHNILVFMRLHRAVGGGVSAAATRHFNALVKALAPLHGLSYVPPSLVMLAARKIYPHRIVLVKPEEERSVQWGSSVEAVREMLEGVTVEDVIEEVLESVETPL